MKRTLVLIVVAAVVVWGLFDPPRTPERRRPVADDAENWGDASLRLELLAGQSGRPVPDARVLLTSPGGRQREAWSDAAGRLRLPFFRLDDYPFRLMIAAPGYEPLDWRLRGAMLARSRRHRIRLQPIGTRRSLRFSIGAPRGLLGAIDLHRNIRHEARVGELRPAGRSERLRVDPETEIVLAGLQPGARLEIEALARVEIDGTPGLAAARRIGPVGLAFGDLGRIELESRLVEGRVRFSDGRSAAGAALSLLLFGFREAPRIHARCDRDGRYALLVPPGDRTGILVIRQGSRLWRHRPWAARGGRAPPIVLPELP